MLLIERNLFPWIPEEAINSTSQLLPLHHLRLSGRCFNEAKCDVMSLSGTSRLGETRAFEGLYVRRHLSVRPALQEERKLELCCHDRCEVKAPADHSAKRPEGKLFVFIFATNQHAGEDFGGGAKFWL